MIQRIHCRACSFWKAGTLSQQRYGTCQRYAPRPVAAGDDFEWARTLEDDWCGEGFDGETSFVGALARMAAKERSEQITDDFESFIERLAPSIVRGRPSGGPESGGLADSILVVDEPGGGSTTVYKKPEDWGDSSA